MSEKNLAVVREYFEQVWKNGRLDRYGEYMAKDVVPHGAPGVTDLESLTHAVGGIKNAFPDLQVRVDDEMAVDDKVVVRTTNSGTHQGDMPGMPATGKQATWSGIVIFRLAGGKIVEFWMQGDTLGMMQQLGVIPTPA